MIESSIILYDRATTRLREHRYNILFLSEIVNVCNYKINQLTNLNKSIKISKNFLIKKLPFELVDLVFSYNNNKLNGEEIKWMLDKSYILYPFECFECGSLMEIDYKIQSNCMWHSVIIYKDNKCDECKKKVKYV